MTSESRPAVVPSGTGTPSKGRIRCRPKVVLLAVLVCWACMVHAADLISPPIAPVELSRLLARPKPPLVVDVRSPDEYSAGHIPGSINIPAPLLGKKSGAIRRAGDVVLYCNDSRFTRVAEHILVKNGVQGFSHLQGGFTAWENEDLPVENRLQ